MSFLAPVGIGVLVDGGGTDPAAGYFPDTRVANDSLWLNPVTGSDMYGEPVEVAFQTGAYPARDDGPQWSWDQGMGRSPGQQWPHMPIREQFNYDSAIMQGDIMEEDTANLPVDANDNPTVGKSERQGWAMLGPAISGEYYEQENTQQYILDPIAIGEAGTMPWTAAAEVDPYQ